MFESNTELEKVVKYMKSHWPSRVKDEWQVGLDEYKNLVKKAVSDLTSGASHNRRLFRVAGISGSGKSSQVLPAVEAYCEELKLKPILVAARSFVKYHPHFKEILDYYGEENLRKMTDEFSTIMLFWVLPVLIKGGYDVILDVTLLDATMEQILVGQLTANDYKMELFMVAVSPVVTEEFLQGRKWRHTKETEVEFVRATEKALGYYADSLPDGQIVIWNVYDLLPVYDGKISRCLEVFKENSECTRIPVSDADEYKKAKRDYLIEKAKR